MALVIAPVPEPSSTTIGAPADGTTDASSSASPRELGAIAPMLTGLRTQAARNARSSPEGAVTEAPW